MERKSVLVMIVALLLAVAVSSLGTLLYYTVTNLSALRLRKEQRSFPRWLALAGLIGCLGLALSLGIEDVSVGLTILAIGIAYRSLRLTGGSPVRSAQKGSRSAGDVR